MKEINQAIIIADLGYGDSGKGTMTDYLCRIKAAHTVIRYNGGAQAAHNVITPDGRHHTFAQFGSGSFVEGVRTYLSRFMVLNPLTMLKEERHLKALGVVDAFDRTSVDAEALITTPYHQAINRLRELVRDTHRHGSCGLGVGETRVDAIEFPDLILRSGDLADKLSLKQKLRQVEDLQVEKLNQIRPHLPKEDEEVSANLALFDCPQTRREVMEGCLDLYPYFSSRVKITRHKELDQILREGTVIFEGAQGVLLDERYGFYPYTTWSNTTFDNAVTLLNEQNYRGLITRLGVIRSYATRHGAGPFVSEDKTLTNLLPEPHNTPNPWQETLRAGFVDFLSIGYGLEVTGGVDAIALTHIDSLPKIPEWKACVSYDYQGCDEINPYFKTEGKTLVKIRPYSGQKFLSYYQQLTLRLQDSQPDYQLLTASRQTKDYINALEERLKVPIKYLSSGPTAKEKQVNVGAAIYS